VPQEEINAEVDRAIAQLGAEVVRVRYTVGEDTAGEPAIYYRIVLTDEAARRDVLSSNTRRIRETLDEILQPYSRWGLFPYSNFRSEPERMELNDPR
jgi:hypothetical protein